MNGAAGEAREVAEQHLQQQDVVIAILHAILAESASTPESICVTDEEINAGIDVDFPIPGAKRWVLKRSGSGMDIGVAAAPAAPIEVMPFNNRRLGGQIVNKGASGVTLILADDNTATTQQGLPRIWLAPNGGSWDFRLASLMWGGSVCAVADAGAGSSLSIAEI